MRIWAWPLKAAAVTLLVAGGACADVAAGAPPPPAPQGGKTASTGERSCFQARDVSSWAAVDRTTVNLRVNVRDFYQVTLLAPCGDIDFSQRIGIRSGRGSDFICTGSGQDIDIIAPTPIGRQTCPATSLRRLTAEEVSALPGRAKP
jgi:hypothetical protein